MNFTVIIPTSESPISCFVRSLCSLILNSNIKDIDQIIVNINGPDSRTGSTEIQDKKLNFCEALKDLGYPITIVRTWSRIGLSAPLDMSLSLVKTEFYLLMHDDTIVIKNSWQEEALNAFKNKNIEAIVSLPVLDKKLLIRLNGLFKSEKDNTKIISHNLFFPSISTTFSVFRRNSNMLWRDYFFETKEEKNISHIKDFFELYPKTYTLLPGQIPNRKGARQGLVAIDYFTKTIYDSKDQVPKNSCRYRKWRCISTKGVANKFSYNKGSWPIYKIISSKKDIYHFSKVIHHIEGMTGKKSKNWESNNPDFEVRKTIEKIKSSNLVKVYNEFVPEIKNVPKLDIKPLICVQVYDRVEDISYWIKTWKKCNQFDGKLLIVQNFDETQGSKEVTEAIQKLKPDYHWRRPNDRQLVFIFELLENKFEIDYDWNVLLFFIDDIWPIRKDFLWPLIYQFEDKKLGITGGYKKTADNNEHENDNFLSRTKGKFAQRDVALAIRKEALLKVNAQILNDDIKKRDDFSYLFENRIGEWIEHVGYKWKCTDYQWPFIFGWDVDNNIQEDLTEKAYSNIEEYEFGVYSWK